MLKKIVHTGLRSMGYEVRRLHQDGSASASRFEKFLQTWSRLSAPPQFIIDVGANHGHWTRATMKTYPESQYLLVEPQERLREYSSDLLAHPNVEWLTAGISDEPGQMNLSLPERDDSATFRPEVTGLPTVEVNITTLNQIVEEKQRTPDMLKIDAEGFDLKALHGATKLLGETDVILVECGVACLELENSLQAICGFMWAHDYRVFQITDLNESPANGALWLAELVFVRNTSPIWSKVTSYE